MGNLILNFLREQGILVVLGLMVAGGLFSQIMASRRYRRLRAGIQSLAALQGGTHQSMAEPTEETVEGGHKRFRRDRRARGQAEMTRQEAVHTIAARQETVHTVPTRQEAVHTVPTRQEAVHTVPTRQEAVHTVPTRQEEPAPASGQNPEFDSQLLYLKQSLDRIAAGRDQKLEEEVREREHRKLTPEQEAIIADILREYLS